MVELYFGLPGAGKTSLIAHEAKKALKKRSPYKNVYCNVKMNMDGLIYVEGNDIGKYQIEDGLLLIDEATINMSNRAYKDLPKSMIDWFLLARHYRVDCKLYSQRWDGIDKNLRCILDRVYYVYKGILTGWFMTKWYRIPYDIIIPDPKNGNGEKLGDIVQGYCKPSLMQRIFCGRLFRPSLYKYFNSFEAPRLKDLPQDRFYHSNVIEMKKNEELKLNVGD